jgi:hypothetical protein
MGRAEKWQAAFQNWTAITDRLDDGHNLIHSVKDKWSASTPGKEIDSALEMLQGHVDQALGERGEMYTNLNNRSAQPWDFQKALLDIWTPAMTAQGLLRDRLEKLAQAIDGARPALRRPEEEDPVRRQEWIESVKAELRKLDELILAIRPAVGTGLDRLGTSVRTRVTQKRKGSLDHK